MLFEPTRCSLAMIRDSRYGWQMDLAKTQVSHKHANGVVATAHFLKDVAMAMFHGKEPREHQVPSWQTQKKS